MDAPGVWQVEEPMLAWLGTVRESQMDYIVCPWGVSQSRVFDLGHLPVRLDNGLAL